MIGNELKGFLRDTIYELLDHFTLEEMIQFGLARNPYTLTRDAILDSLCHSVELKQDNVIVCLKGNFWELIVDDLRTLAEQYRKRNIQYTS